MSKTIYKARGIAVWPHLNTPDTKFKDDGEFHTKIRISADVAAPILETLSGIQEARIAQARKDKPGKPPKAVDLPVQPEYDSETGEATGNYLLKAAMKASGINRETQKRWDRQLPLFDSTGTPARNFVKSGSDIIVAYRPDAWVNPKAEVGVKLYLEAVQIISLVGSAPTSEKFGFDAVDGGYVATEVIAANDNEPEAGVGEQTDGEGTAEGYDFD